MFDTTHHDTRQVRRNLLGHIIDGAMWVWGMNAVASVEVVFPWLIQNLGGTGLHIALIPFVMRAGFLTPQIFAAPFIERARRKGPLVLIFGTGMRIPLLAIVYLLYSGHVTGHPPSPWSILGWFLLMMTIGGITAPAWLDFLASTIPVQYRGRQFGIRIAIGGVLGVLSGPLLVTPIQSHFPFPLNAAILIGIAFVIVNIGLAGLLLPRDLDPPSNRRHESFRHYLFTHVPSILKGNRNFQTFLIIKALALGSSGLSMGFFMVYGLWRFNLDDAWTGTFVAALMCGTVVGTPILGAIVDRYGHRLTIMLSLFLMIVSNIWAILAPSPWLYAVTFFLLACFRNAEVISFLGMSLEFSTPEDRPTFIAVSNSTMLPLLIAGLMGGFLYDYTGRASVFVASVLMATVALVLAFTLLVEPRNEQFIMPEVPPER